ncbi:uncharacterized protein BDV17DRAFT_279900 [Aspergillus undulatus]|uniref:uncharacterized protein n=1 Tax=Aspergillus undulatus TaxID=1810928 RepID=UPI003CCCC090
MHIHALSLALLSTGVFCRLPLPEQPKLERRATTQIPSDSFNDFETFWNYLASDGVLTLTAESVSGEEDPIHYLSGTIHVKSTFPVEAGGYDVKAEFIAPVATGTGWPPEIDIAEWKGSGKISFNTFNTSGEVTALDVGYINPDDWHSVKAELRDENGADISGNFYLDEELVTT